MYIYYTVCRYICSNLQQSSSSDPSMQSKILLHQELALTHACELLHLLSPEYGQDLRAKRLFYSIVNR